MKLTKFSGQADFNKHIRQRAVEAHDGSQYFWSRSQFIDVSAGVDDAGKPIVLDATGLIDSSMLPGGIGVVDFVDLGDVPSSYSGVGGYFVKVNSGADGLEFVSHTLVTAFTELSDVPSSYSGAGGYFVRVTSGADGLEFVAGGGGVVDFTDLGDVPSSYAGAGGYFVRVTSGADGLEFVAGGGGVSSFTDLDDVPAVYTDCGNFTVKVNSAASGLEFVEFWLPDDYGYHLPNYLVHLGIGSLSNNSSHEDFTLHCGGYALFYSLRINAPEEPVGTGWGTSGFFLDDDSISGNSDRYIQHLTFGVCANGAGGDSGGYIYRPLLLSNEAAYLEYGATSIELLFGGTYDDIQVYFTASRTLTMDDKVGGIHKRTMSSVLSVGSDGSGNGQYSTPFGICADATYLYVCDFGNDRLQKLLKSDGSYVDEVAIDAPTGVAIWGGYLYVLCGTGESYPIQKYLASDLSYVAGYSSWGVNTLDSPYGICIATKLGEPWIYICDNGYNRIFSCDLTGGSTAYIGTYGSGDANYDSPVGIATDGNYLYVVDAGNSRVKKIDMAMSYEDEFTITDAGTGGIAVDEEYVYVGGIIGGTTSCRITKYSKKTFSSVSTYTMTGGASGTASIYGMCLYRKYSRGNLIEVSREGWYTRIFNRLDLFREIRLYEKASAPYGFISIEAPSSVSQPYWLVLPDALPSSSKVLVCSSAGVLSWGSGSGIGDSFLDLTDTPSAYTGFGSYFVKVKSDVSGLEFVAAVDPSHNLLSSTHSDVDTETVVAGDLIYGNTTPKWDRLGKGADGEIFEMVSGAPAWGRKLTVSSSVPSGGDDGDIHFQYSET